jgi:hypothetical protein
VDKLRKIGLWVWFNKERMVLAVMLVALGFQVYKVWNPEEPEVVVHKPPARPALTEQAQVQIPAPPPPISPPPPSPPGAFADNPFSRYTGGARERETEGVNVRVLRIREWHDGSYRAELRHGAERGWYGEGESFGTFEVLRIDPESQTVEIYSSELNRRVQLSVGR